MVRSIKQSVKFRNVSAAELFDIYTDSARHGAAVNSTASVSAEVGRAFWVFDENGVKGRNLHVVPKSMVVQTWRSNLFGPSDPDSVLTLTFSDVPDGARIDLFQVNVPDNLYANTHGGWRRMYWPAWREYVKRKSV